MGNVIQEEKEAARAQELDSVCAFLRRAGPVYAKGRTRTQRDVQGLFSVLVEVLQRGDHRDPRRWPE